VSPFVSEDGISKTFYKKFTRTRGRKPKRLFVSKTGYATLRRAVAVVFTYISLPRRFQNRLIAKNGVVGIHSTTNTSFIISSPGLVPFFDINPIDRNEEGDLAFLHIACF
jgi:hypothetical protein